MIRRNRPRGRGQGKREANVERQLGRGRNKARTADAGRVGGVVLRRGVVFLLEWRGLGETEPIAIEEPD